MKISKFTDIKSFIGLTPEVIVGQLPVSSGPEDKARRERLVLVLRRQSDVVLERAAIDGEPLSSAVVNRFLSVVVDVPAK
jgi:hypothetical protein